MIKCKHMKNLMQIEGRNIINKEMNNHKLEHLALIEWC